MEDMSIFWYKKWYNEEVKPNLTRDQRFNLMKKLSEMSLRTPFQSGIKIQKKELPEISNFTKLKEFSGLQLYVVFTELGKEFLGT